MGKKSFLAAGIAIVTGGLLYFISRSGKIIKQLDLKIIKLSIKKFSLTKVICFLDLQVENPTRTSITLQKIDLDCYVESKRIGTITRDKVVTIPARKALNITGIQVEISSMNAVNQFLNILLKNNIVILIKGTIKADGLKIPVNERKEFALKKK